MKFIQIVPNLSYGDAVSNDILALKNLFSNLGHQATVYALVIDARIPGDGIANFDTMPKPEKDNILIYHMASSCKVMTDFLLRCDCRKVMVYHNITPPHFFNDYSKDYVNACEAGLHELQILKDTFECCIADSEFNKQDLRKAGYTCPIAVLPILIPFEDYGQEPDQEVLARYSNDGWTNLLFVGRIAPNKCQEDVIAAFAAYKEKYNGKCRLFIVGNYNGMETYYERLQQYVERNHVEDVVFTGHISFRAILAYYHLADIFLCMSEHEGFCVPLIEAMNFKIPVIAYSSTAIPYTLKDAGIILEKKNPTFVAAVVDEVVRNTELRRKLIEKQNERLSYFRYDNVAQMAEKIILKLVNGEDIESLEKQCMTGINATPIKSTSLFSQINIQTSTLNQNQITKGWVPFSQIPVPKLSTKQSKLFRCYSLVHSFAPGLADFIRDNIKK